MSAIQCVTRGSLIFSLLALLAGCVIAPREGYYDRDHHRYYHDHSWHPCQDRGDRGYRDDRSYRDDRDDRDDDREDHCRR